MLLRSVWRAVRLRYPKTVQWGRGLFSGAAGLRSWRWSAAPQWTRSFSDDGERKGPARVLKITPDSHEAVRKQVEKDAAASARTLGIQDAIHLLSKTAGTQAETQVFDVRQQHMFCDYLLYVRCLSARHCIGVATAFVRGARQLLDGDPRGDVTLSADGRRSSHLCVVETGPNILCFVSPAADEVVPYAVVMEEYEVPQDQWDMLSHDNEGREIEYRDDGGLAAEMRRAWEAELLSGGRRTAEQRTEYAFAEEPSHGQDFDSDLEEDYDSDMEEEIMGRRS